MGRAGSHLYLDASSFLHGPTVLQEPTGGAAPSSPTCRLTPRSPWNSASGGGWRGSARRQHFSLMAAENCPA